MREYIVQGSGLTVPSGASTLILINPPASRAIKIVRVELTQTSSTTSAQVAVELGFKASAFGTYTGVTPEKTKSSDPISYIVSGAAGAAGTAGINTGAAAEGAGTFTRKVPGAFNTLAGYLWTPNDTLGEAFILSGADSLAWCVRFPSAPATLTGWNVSCTYAEVS